MKTVKIILCDKEVEVTSGFFHVSLFYKKSGVDPKNQWLYLNQDKDIDIPLLPGDYIIIHGGEKILVGDINTDIGENPNVRNPVRLNLNGKQLESDIKQAKLTGNELRKFDTELDSSKLFADLSGQVDVFIQDDWLLVVQEKDCYITIPLGDDDAIDLEECARNNRKPPKGQECYKIKIDGEKYRVNKPMLTGLAILALVEKTFGDYSLNQKFHGGLRKPVEVDQEIDFTQLGVERFETAPKLAQQGLC